MIPLEIVLASNNINKLTEIRNLIPHSFKLLTLQEVDILSELPETTGTIKGNAIQKAKTAHELCGKNCLADDSGLMVESLDNEPGVDSAMYAGLPKNNEKNIEKLLSNLADKDNRKAKFVTVLALILDGKEFVFEGEVHGEITNERAGNYGFGYDPVFKPLGYEQTFAEMSSDDKNKISHRAIALKKLVEFFGESYQIVQVEKVCFRF